MATTIYGLTGTEGVKDNRFKSVRRKVFYFYPNGASPLLALLSMLPDEQCNDPEFSVFEDRLPEKSSKTAASSNVIFHATGTTGSTTPGSILSANPTPAVGHKHCIRVADRAKFRKDHIVEIYGIPLAAGGTVRGLFRVIDTPFVSSSVDYIRVEWMAATGEIDYDGFTADLTVMPIGNAAEQGQVGSEGQPHRLPVQIWNYLQIFRTSFTMTGTALKTPVDFDKTGVYKDKAKKQAFNHFTDIEFAFLFGERTKSVDTTTNLPRYTTGGILWYLSQWEGGSTYGNTAPSADTDDGKRIIENADGVITADWLDNLLERVFRFTSNNSNEKLGLIGNGALQTLNNLYKGQNVLQANQLLTGKVGMNVTSQETPFGTIHWKTAPLFTQEPTLRYNCMILDVADMKYRYMEGRDTKLLKHREPNDADYRKDEWLGEVGLELVQPEANMYVKNMLQHSI